MPMELTALCLVGYILLIVLAVIIVMVLLLLFSPFRYELDAKVKEEISARFKVRFLAGIFEFALVYKQEQLLMRIRLLGFKKRLKKKEDSKKDKKSTPKDSKNNISDTIKNFLAFVSDKENRGLVKYILPRAFKLLKKIAPDVIKTNFDFSLGKPDRTGYLTGAISLIPIVYMYDIHAYPDFDSEQMYLKGIIHIQGKIHIIYLLAFAIGLLKNKKIREVIKKIRRSKDGRKG
ncbi:hypothetical protein SAMN02910417_00732 [Eubacterium oxidoreducens]|uniref:DUF2953 domain-containing protein n=2 Tax=Eubacterium oxidoreducens TaxID=1732 RepID=A0A1G6AMQ5_EUBOX|nr:hypothetical protein SAMN02910417_00732 [Eubacterium oxidoreducens]